MFRSSLSTVLSLLLVAAPAWASPPEQTAGVVGGVIPNATRNAQPVGVKATLQWNDLLQTNTKGRLRANLTDGSILSLGSNSQLRVVQHDAKSQQTEMDLDYGKLRNQVVKITQPGGKYQVKTPNAVIGVIGTDFYVAYANNQTIVVCYDGVISVTPLTGAPDSDRNNPPAVQVAAGQMVVISGTPATVSQPVASPAKVVTASTHDTSVEEQIQVAKSHRGRVITIVALGVVAGLTIGLTQANSSSKPCGCK
jgi:hypothetical protein